MQLNLEQKRLIQAKPGGHLLLKGVAGSGKTTVAVHRIPFLLNHYCFAGDDSILMVTYNKTLVNYIKYLFEKVDDEDKAEYQSIFDNKENKIGIETIDSIMYSYYFQYKKENRLKYEVIDSKKEKYIVMAECISEIGKTDKSVNIIDQRFINFLLDEIDWLKSCNYMELEEYQNADRIGRMGKQNIEGPQKLMKNSDTRRAIYELMILFNKRLLEKGYIDFKDMAILALRQVQKKVNKKYTHIIIDESQDLTRIQLEFLKLLLLPKEYSSIMFVCDTAQSIYQHSWLVKGRSFTSIGFDMTGKSNSLSKNYRTTTQIAEAAYSLIENDSSIIEDENFVKPSLIDRQGSYPVCRYFKSIQEESEYILSEIKSNILIKYRKKDIVIIAKNRSQLKHIKEFMDNSHMDCVLISKTEEDFEVDSVKLLTMHSIKGLEFKVVFIVGINKDVIPYMTYQGLEDESIQESSDRRLLYVGMTRANEYLYITTSGIPSKFIEEINSKYLKLNNTCRFRKYYNISLDEFEYKNKIIDLYSKEERVRQWAIRELIESYKYPKGLIEVEYKINNFSKTGSVDAAVLIYNSTTKIPYVLIETKALGQGVEAAVRQLKSYMSNCNTCNYGVATDGNEICILNKDMEIIEDIPLFNPSMLPSSIENYSYIDLKFNNTYTVMRDSENTDEILVDNLSEKLTYYEEAIKRIPIYSNIAAGQPIYMVDDMNGYFPLPAEWFKGKDSCFMLKIIGDSIIGDSMIGANIKDGDYVVIQKQETAQNRDIVAVAIDENATLKRFTKMGDTVLLIPENEKYEPIQMKSEQINIIGTAIGIVKRL